MTDFAHSLRPCDRRKLRRKPLNLSAPTGMDCIVSNTTGRAYSHSDYHSKVLVPIMRVVDALEPDERFAVHVIGAVRFSELYPRRWNRAIGVASIPIDRQA